MCNLETDILQLSNETLISLSLSRNSGGLLDKIGSNYRLAGSVDVKMTEKMLAQNNLFL